MYILNDPSTSCSGHRRSLPAPNQVGSAAQNPPVHHSNVGQGCEDDVKAAMGENADRLLVKQVTASTLVVKHS